VLSLRIAAVNIAEVAASMLLAKSTEKAHGAFWKWMISRSARDKAELDEADNEVDYAADIEEKVFEESSNMNPPGNDVGSDEAVLLVVRVASPDILCFPSALNFGYDRMKRLTSP
jgi:hypothetical protein